MLKKALKALKTVAAVAVGGILIAGAVYVSAWLLAAGSLVALVTLPFEWVSTIQKGTTNISPMGGAVGILFCYGILAVMLPTVGAVVGSFVGIAMLIDAIIRFCFYKRNVDNASESTADADTATETTNATMDTATGAVTPNDSDSFSVSDLVNKTNRAADPDAFGTPANN